MEKQQRGKIDLNYGLRGWLTIIYCFLAFVIGGAFLGAWQAIVTVNGAVYGWNTTFMFSLNQYASAIMCVLQLGVFAMILKSKINIARLSYILLAVFGVAAIVMNVKQDNQILLSVFFCIAFIASNAQTMLTGVITGNWWPNKRGMVIGITTIGIPLGSAFGTGLYTTISNVFGANNVFLVYGIIGFIIFVYGLLTLKQFPEDCGAYPDNDPTMDRAAFNAGMAELQKVNAHNPWTFKTLITNGQVWLIICIGICTMLSNNILMMQAANRLVVFGGMDLVKVLSMISLAAIFACFGSPIIGVIDTKLGTKKMAVIMCLMTIVAVALQYGENYTRVFIGMLIFGIEMGGASNLLVSLASDAFPRQSSSRAFALIQPLMQLLQTGVALILINMAPIFGSYSQIYTIYIVLLVVVMIIFGIKYDSSKIRAKDKEMWEKVHADEEAGLLK